MRELLIIETLIMRYVLGLYGDKKRKWKLLQWVLYTYRGAYKVRIQECWMHQGDLDVSHNPGSFKGGLEGIICGLGFRV